MIDLAVMDGLLLLPLWSSGIEPGMRGMSERLASRNTASSNVAVTSGG
jgi:hypothetical protein